MNNKAQNIVEYILLTVAVIVVLLVFVKRDGPIHQRLDKSMGMTTNALDAINREITFEGTPDPLFNTP